MKKEAYRDEKVNKKLNGEDYTKEKQDAQRLFIFYLRYSISYTIIMHTSYHTLPPLSVSDSLSSEKLGHLYMRKLGQHGHKTDNKYLDS